MRPAIQLYTLRALDDSLPDLLRRVGETAFEGVEFAGLGDSDPADVADALDDAGLEAAAAHVGIDDLEDDPGGVAETYRQLGCETLVVPYLPEADFANAKAVADTGRRLTELAARLDEAGANFAYHNHDHEFTELGESSGFELLAGETDIDLELDVGWADAASHDPVDLLGRLRDRVPLVHLKDVGDGEPVELGEGQVDAEACVEAARDAGAEWLVYEHDEPTDPEASLHHGAETLDSLLE
ncbi:MULTISPECIES: sugar phosphate isomerase/epimerase family protein [Halorussus]|uniref:sugar phosphate isomerase/epimerase family protein n=1 Tax=Halorussus TaxID=1070314 RepID=UPI00209E34D8|nr:sugar phosphate isomerase/epimerase [Halorussus vallis]USZ77149.1 sugar phosphate isomerase/epimerase [Halorussus vallis]